jgi:CheY-like chemotaxis protein
MGLGKKVLVVEDEEGIRKVFELALLHHKVCEAVYTAKNSMEGLVILAKKPDIIFLDYNMPGMNGDLFLQELRTNPAYEAHKDTRVVAIGDFPETDSPIYDERLEKPFGLPEIRESFDRLLSAIPYGLESHVEQTDF